MADCGCHNDSMLDLLREVAPDLARAQMSLLKGCEIKWRHLDGAVESRLSSVLASWVGTPYMAGQHAKGMGIDCVQLVGAVLDELFRSPQQTVIPRIRADSAIHSRRAGFSTIVALRKCFPSFPVREDCIEPGDVILTRASHDIQGPRNPGHAMIAGVRPGSVLHAIPGPGVCMSSIEATNGIIRVYRPKGKATWAL